MELEELAQKLGEALKRVQATIATAESCTGGWVSQVVTSIPGSSHWFERGFVSYTNIAKREMLGVTADVIARFGAVSEKTARAMAEGALTHSRADYSLAITGIAGPSGGTPEKPVGTVCFAWAHREGETISAIRHFEGDRRAVRRQAVEAALQGLLDYLG